MMSMTRPLLVGEDNPHSRDPRMALYPAPTGCAGHRLCTKVLELRMADYIARFERVNLCSVTWSLAEARLSAARIFGQSLGRVVVLLGAKVAHAFGLEYAPFTIVRLVTTTFVILPHPSGRSRAWNEPGAYERARAVLREAGAL